MLVLFFRFWLFNYFFFLSLCSAATSWRKEICCMVFDLRRTVMFAWRYVPWRLLSGAVIYEHGGLL